MENRISREFLFKKVLLDNHAVGITLNSKEKIVVVELSSSDEERKEMVSNLTKSCNTYGEMGVFLLNPSTGEKIYRRINTNNIQYVESLK